MVPLCLDALPWIRNRHGNLHVETQAIIDDNVVVRMVFPFDAIYVQPQMPVIGCSSISFFIKYLIVPSEFINCASGLTKSSATCRMHPKKEYSKTHGQWSIQLTTSAVNANTSCLFLETEAISEMTTGYRGYLLCLLFVNILPVEQDWKHTSSQYT